MVQFPSSNGLVLESGIDMRRLGESRKSHSNTAPIPRYWCCCLYLLRLPAA